MSEHRGSGGPTDPVDAVPDPSSPPAVPPVDPGPPAAVPVDSGSPHSEQVDSGSPLTAPADPGGGQATSPEPADPRTADPQLADPPPADPQLADPAPADPELADPALADPPPAGPELAGPAPVRTDPVGVDGAGRAPGAGDGATARDADTPRAPAHLAAPRRRVSSAGALIWVLLALFGFTFVVQLRSNDTDQGLAATRQEDLVRILSDLEARDTRLNSEIATLAESRQRLTSGVQGRQAALEEAERRANELGLLAGTLPARGPGIVVRMSQGEQPLKASAVLNAVQELRGSGGEVMQLAGGDGSVVRLVASSAFVDRDGGVAVDGVRLTGPFTLTVIGAPQTMEGALNIPGGVVASVRNVGGTVIPEQRKTVEVTAVRKATSLQYARPVA